MIRLDEPTFLKRSAALGAAFVVLVATFVATVGARPGLDRAAAQDLGGGAANFVYAGSWPIPQAPAEPVDLTVAHNGNLFVADGRDNAILVYDDAGSIVDRWHDPPTGSFPGHVYVPQALTSDLAREVVYVLWRRYAIEQDGLVEGGFFLDPRRVDGTSARPLQALTFLADAVDLAVEPTSGDIFFLTGSTVTRLTVPGGVPIYGFLVGAGAQRVAVTEGGVVAVVRTGQHRLERYQLDGELLDTVDMAGLSPLDAVRDEGDGLYVLVRAAVAADPDADLVVRVDDRGSVTTHLVAADLAAPVPPDGAWPWALSWAPGGGALSTGDVRFEIHRYRDVAASGAPLQGGPVRAVLEAHPEDATLIGAGLSLAPHADGELSVLDIRSAQVHRFDATGQARLVASAPEHAIDMAVDVGGAHYISTADGWLQRMSAVAGAPPAWVIPCECSLGGRLAVVGDMLHVTRPRQQSVVALDAHDGVYRHELRVPDAVGLWPVDVAADYADSIYSADLVTARVHAWSGATAPDAVWRAGLLSGPRRLAVGQLPDGTSVLAAVMADGFVELHSGVDGNLIGRWLPTVGGANGPGPDVSDIAMGANGEVYLADAGARAVHVFEPAGGIPPTDEPMPAPSPTPSDLACDVRGDKLVSPSTVVLGSSAVVTLTLAADCPARTRLVGADIVLVMDRSGSMQGTKLTAAKGAARSFAEMLDVRVHRLGLTSFSTDATVDVPLTDAVADVIDGLEALRPDGGTNIAAALTQARDNLATFGRPSALPVVVLLSDGRLSEQQPDPRAAAAEVRSWGAQVYTIGLGTDVDGLLLEEIAGRADRYYGAPTPAELFPIYGEILREVVSSLAGNLVIDDELSGDLRYVTGSARPLALESPGRLRWGRSILPSSGLTLTYEVRPRVVGCVPTSKRAHATYTDGDGVRRTYTFPVPSICAIAGTATATPPPTHTPRPSPTATARPVSSSLHLPVAYRHACVPGRAHADVVLLIDTSSSMGDVKLADAKSAANLFLEHLRFPLDQAAVVGFDAHPLRAIGLTTDRDAATRAVAGLQVGSGTRIDLALHEAIRVLTDPGHRPGNRPVIVLLSDGEHGGLRLDAVNAAADAHDLGALVFTIGLGTGADGVLLEELAGNPARYFFAPTGRDLAAIYRQIAVTIPCK